MASFAETHVRYLLKIHGCLTRLMNGYPWLFRLKTVSEKLSPSGLPQLFRESQCKAEKQLEAEQVRSNSDSKEESDLSSRSPKGGLLRQSLAITGMSMGCLLDGTVIAYSSPALPSLLSENSNITLTVSDVSWIGSVHTLGAVLGCMISVWAMSLLGRRGAALYLMSLAYAIGYIIIATAVDVKMIIIGRLFGGVGLGLTLSITPVYLVEISNILNRSLLGVIPPLLTQVGLLITYLAGIWVDWKSLALTGLALMVPHVLFIWAIPESPHHLAIKGKYKEVELSLQTLGREENPGVYYQQIRSGAHEASKLSENNKSFRKSIAEKYLIATVWKPTVICICLTFFFQATGFNTVVAYSKLIIKGTGLSINENLASGITGAVILGSTAFAIGFSKLFSRKSLMLTSAFGTSIILTVLATYYYLNVDGQLDDLPWLPLGALMLFICMFMSGYGALIWTIMAELLPAAVRGNIYPFAVAMFWIFNFGFSYSFSYIQNYFGTYTAFWTFSGLSFIGGIFIKFFLPETKNKTPDQIAAEFMPEDKGAESRVTSVSDLTDLA